MIKGYNKSKQQVNNKGVDQTVQMNRLICCFAVRIGINKNFIMTSLNLYSCLIKLFSPEQAEEGDKIKPWLIPTFHKSNCKHTYMNYLFYSHYCFPILMHFQDEGIIFMILENCSSSC